MLSISGKIKKLSLNGKNDIYRLISDKLMEGFYKGYFYQEKELADLCYTGCSTVTKYAKSLGVSGYRELVIRLHYEYETISANKKRNKDAVTGEDCPIMNTIKWLGENDNFLQTLANSILENRTMTIFGSYQAYGAIKYFQAIMAEFDIQVNVVTGQDVIATKKLVNKNKLNIFVITGQDTNQLMFLIDRMFDYKEKENFLISTPGQYEKIDFELNDKLIIDIPFTDGFWTTRMMILQNFFFKLHHIIKEKMSN